MSKIIIGIHGLGNKPSKRLLRKWWKKSIREGLKAIGYPRLFFKFELVYWANYLHPEPLKLKVKDKKNPLYIKEPYRPAEVFIRKKPSKLRLKILDYLEKQLDKIFLKEDMSIHFSAVSDMIIRRFFKDLDAYYSQTCINLDKKDCLVKDVLRKKLAHVIKKHRKKEILVIGHSMGSIIAYDVLTQSVPQIDVDTFVTIGSPLGLPVIMCKIAAELNRNCKKEPKLTTPENVVRNWYNFSDLEDKVSINYNLGDDYDENSHHIRAIDKIVLNNYEHNGHRNPHKIYGYLRTPEFSEVVNEFLNRGRNKNLIWLIEKISNWLYKVFTKSYPQN